MNNSTENKKKVRSTYFIDKPFQTKFILRFVFVILVGLAVTLSLLGYYSQTKFKEGLYFKSKDIVTIIETLQGGKILEKSFKPTPLNRLQLFWKPVVSVSVFYMVLLMVFGLFYSHRMAGPLYRIQKNLQGYIEGDDVQDIRIRKNDHFQELVSLLNELIKEKRKR